MGRKVKVLNLQVNTYGNYLGIDKGCITLRDKEKNVQSSFRLYDYRKTREIHPAGCPLHCQNLQGKTRSEKGKYHRP